MKVEVEVQEITLSNNEGQDLEGTEVTCTRCDHAVEVFGTSDASVRRGCVMLREECPNKERNFYTKE
jgi:hypothetical protein